MIIYFRIISIIGKEKYTKVGEKHGTKESFYTHLYGTLIAKI